jgi:elongation factor Ts
LDAAVEFLKKKGVLQAGKKAGRETNEGLVKFVTKDGLTAGIKLLCETDFVAKNDTFNEFLDTLLDNIFESKLLTPDLASANADLVEKLNTLVAEFVGKIGENVQLGDMLLTDENAYAYNHPGNRVATLVFFTGDDTGVAKEVALQVAAMVPQYLSIENVPADMYKEMSESFRKELLETGKPENVVEQILVGKMNKALSDFVLLEQAYIRDGAKKIKDILPAGFEIKKYIRYAI